MGERRMRIRDWTFVLMNNDMTDPLMYVHHHCSMTGDPEIEGGNLTRCHKCKTPVPDDIHALLTMYNWDHPWRGFFKGVK